MEGYDPAAGLFQNNANGPCSKIQLFISCKKLMDLDYVGKSDPYCQVWLKNDERSPWVNIDKTETIQNELDPVFSTPITIDYFFEKTQEIRFEVWDEDPSNSEAQGMHTTKVGSLVGAKNQTYIAKLSLKGKDKKRGEIIVKTDSIKESNMSVKMGVRAKGLKSKKRMKVFKSNHPFLVIKRCVNHHDSSHENALKVFTSETKDKTLDPSWKTINMRLQNLCNSDIDLPLIYEIWSYDDDGDHKLYGRVQTTVRKIQEHAGKPFDVIKKKGEPYGELYFSQFDTYQVPTMVDYLRSGWVISLSVAIDFTASNGELSDPESLHYIDPNDPNKMTAYEQAILQVGGVLESYDHDRQFPVFGFGAKPRFMGVDDVMHCFHLNGNQNPEVHGVNGILQAYRQAMHGGVGLYGPTNFSPCLEVMMQYIKGRANLAEYNIMLYITDGAITDMADTISK